MLPTAKTKHTPSNAIWKRASYSAALHEKKEERYNCVRFVLDMTGALWFSSPYTRYTSVISHHHQRSWGTMILVTLHKIKYQYNFLQKLSGRQGWTPLSRINRFINLHVLHPTSRNPHTASCSVATPPVETHLARKRDPPKSAYLTVSVEPECNRLAVRADNNGVTVPARQLHCRKSRQRLHECSLLSIGAIPANALPDPARQHLSGVCCIVSFSTLSLFFVCLVHFFFIVGKLTRSTELHPPTLLT